MKMAGTGARHGQDFSDRGHWPRGRARGQLQDELTVAATASSGGRPRDDETRSEHVQRSYGQQKFPAESHQQIVANAWTRAAHPDIEEQEAKHLQSEPEDRQNHSQPL